MSTITGVVPQGLRHKHVSRGDLLMKQKAYDATYEIGNTVVHIVAPPKKTQAEVDQILKEFHRCGWSILEEIEEKMRQKKDQ